LRAECALLTVVSAGRDESRDANVRVCRTGGFNDVAVDREEPERDDPFGGGFGAALGVRAGDFVFTSALSGVTAFIDGVPRYAETFDEQLRLVGEHLARRLAHFGCTTADIVDAIVWLHPSVEIRPGTLLDRLQAEVFFDTSPTLSVARVATPDDDVLVCVKVIAYRPAAGSGPSGRH
jgi:enamine deaminase RidA (YjgF/YER057c/UK114 family)